MAGDEFTHLIDHLNAVEIAFALRVSPGEQSMPSEQNAVCFRFFAYGPLDEHGPGDAPVDEQEAERRAREREAVVERTKAEWEAAEEAAGPGDPVPAEEVVEQYVEE